MNETPFSKAGNALLWQATQHLGVKVIFLIRLLVLARLLSPDDFGLLAIASVVIDMFLRVTDVGMMPALVQRVEAAEEHYDVAWTIGILRALAIASVTILAAPIIAQLFAEPRATDIIRVLALRPLIDAGANIRVAQLTRNLNFRSLAFIELPKALANTLIAIALAHWLGVWALVAGTLAGSIAYLIISYMVAPYRLKLSFEFNAVRSLIRFGQWVFFTSLTVMAGQSVLRLVIARQLGVLELGLYYLAASLAFLPSDIGSQVVGQVAFPFYSRLQTDVQQVTVAFRTIVTSLAALLIPANALLIALAPSLVDHILSPNWQGTAGIIRALALASTVGLLGDTIGPILKGAGRPDRILVIELVQSSILIALAWFLADRYGVIGAALAWLPATGITQIAGILFLHQILSHPFAGLGRPISMIVAISVIAAIVALGVDRMVPGVLGLLLASLTGIILVGCLLWTLERRFRIGISDGLVRAFPRIAALMGLPHR